MRSTATTASLSSLSATSNKAPVSSTAPRAGSAPTPPGWAVLCSPTTADDRAVDDAGVGDSVDAVKTGQRDGVFAMAMLLYAVVVPAVNARTRK